MTVRSRRWYISLEAVKAELGLTGTTKDARLKRLIERASAWLEQTTRRVFVPVTQTCVYDAPAGVSAPLWLDQDLLTATAVSDAGGDLAGSEYVLYPANGVRKNRIELASGVVWETGASPRQALSVSGLWGYSADLDATGASLAAAITSTTATTLTVSDGTLIETGWSLLIDSEQLFVVAVSGVTVTVGRGANGTTATSHSLAATIYRYVPAPAIEEATATLVTMWYAWQDAGGVKSKTIGDYTVSYVDGWPVPDVVEAIVRTHRRVKIAGLSDGL